MAATTATTIIRPDPDPTLLTTENLRREIANLKELSDTKFGGVSNSIGSLHDLFTAELDKLASVTAERFTAVGAQFTERDTRTDQRAGDTKLAVDAAFAAAKEATAEIKTGFTKSIDALQTLITANTKAADDKIDDLKERLTTMEARTQGIGSANQDNRALVFAVIGSVFGVIALFIAAGSLITAITSHSH
jgi:hypothetical protein